MISFKDTPIHVCEDADEYPFLFIVKDFCPFCGINIMSEKMRLGDLIKTLQDFYEKHGNIRVTCRTMGPDINPRIRPWNNDEVILVLNNANKKE